MAHKKDETALRDIGIIIGIFVVLFFLLVPLGCSGWSIMGYDISPNDSTSVAIIDQDSTIHRYLHPVLILEDNWCEEHKIWERVERLVGE